MTNKEAREMRETTALHAAQVIQEWYRQYSDELARTQVRIADYILRWLQANGSMAHRAMQATFSVEWLGPVLTISVRAQDSASMARWEARADFHIEAGNPESLAVILRRLAV